VPGHAKGARDEVEIQEYRMVKMTDENFRKQDNAKRNLRYLLQHFVWILAKNKFFATTMVKCSDFI
jgi:hypothetical protein